MSDKALTREQLESASGTLEYVDLSDTGVDGGVWLKEVGASIFEELSEKYKDKPIKVTAALLTRCICNKSGERLYGDGDVAVVAAMPARRFGRLVEAATAMNELGDLEETAKNSEATSADDSGLS